jgi:hypothetical protein
MKKRLLAVLLAVIVVVLTVSLSSADDLPGTGYWFGATHQNVGDANATIVVTAYDQANNQYPLNLAPLAPGASANVIPSDIPGLPAGFIGSIVTSSDQPLVALVNITNRPIPDFGDPNGKAAALYSGVDGSDASTSLLFPLAKHNSFDKTTTFYLQNAGTEAATITAVFAFQGVNYTYTSPSVQPGRMIAVDPGMTTNPGPVPSGDGKVGAMTATSAQPIAGVMLEHEVGFPVGLVMQGSSGFAPSQLDQTAYCPVYKKHHFGRSSGLQVQNAHNVAQNFTIEYIATVSGNEYTTVVTNVAPGASVTLLNDASITDPLDTLLAATVTGSAGPVAAVMNESQLPLPPGVQQTATTHNCQAATTATTTLAYPAFKETRFGRTTSIQIQNVGDAAATNVVLVFKDNLGNTRTTVPQTINPGASKVFLCVSGPQHAGLWSGSPLDLGTLSGVTVTADQPIIAVVNEASWSSSSPCLPDNGPTSFDKTTSNTFSIDD